MRAVSSLPLLLAACSAAACSTGRDLLLPSGPPPADTTTPVFRLSRVSGDSQTAMAGSRLPAPLVVAVLDTAGRGVEGVEVRFAAVDAGALLAPVSGTVRSGGDGRAAVAVTLGSQAATVRVVAASPAAFGTATFTLVATPQPPPTLAAVSGDSQVVALPGAALDPFTVVVRDVFGRPAVGQQVAFLVTSGNASFAGQSTLTVTADRFGVASAALSTPVPAEGDTVRVEASIPGALSPALRFLATGLPFRDRRWEIGALYACAVATNGAAYCWGFGESGRLGTGNSSSSAAPAEVVGGTGFFAVYAGAATCALASTGVATCWGSPAAGGAGQGGRAYRSVNVGSTGACGVSGTGSVHCWGGQAAPTRASVRLVSVSVGYHSACGLTADGRAYCWGDNSYGQLGWGGASTSDSLVPVGGGLSFRALSVGYLHACGLTGSGVAYCWGRNSDGQLGNGGTSSQSQPTAVAGGLAFTDISLGYYHTCALTAAGAAYCWGKANSGQLGNGATSPSPVTTPAPVVGGHALAAVSAGAEHACGIDTAGQAWCWGANSYGQLGTGSFSSTPSAVPTAVTGGLLFRP